MLPAGIGADYKKQETYYASQEYKDGVEQALETGNKLPTLETRDRKITSRNRNKKLPPLSYPLATGSNQRTGDRLVIKCLKFEPPESGAGATVTPINMFKKEKDGTKVSAITSADKKLMSDDENVRGKGNKRMKVYNEKGELMNGTERPGIDFKVTDIDNDGLDFWGNNDGGGMLRFRRLQPFIDTSSTPWTYHNWFKTFELDFGSFIHHEFLIASNPLSISDNLKENINVYPNPTNENFIIDGYIGNNSTLLIIDQMGKIIYSEKINSNFIRKSINFEKYSAGLYTIKIKSPKVEIYKKIVKQ